ncbi:hypothetical protein [Bacillus sp. FJAT-49736]|uniref:hypothetical protein n=1 Tax=Bacillus sp. FJAT-49736 TaxID=2833582 RepID=UPI001BC930B6|nr:hypothetical protein [Bacillus sp. FJAT-49736]MBS4172122.1 hypothetical protein [Bacillus sp. FJAT-49736]
MSNQKAATYTKDQFLLSIKFAKHKDLINALLNKDEKYTTSQVEKLINDFLKKVVK